MNAQLSPGSTTSVGSRRLAVITGGSRGIGSALAERFALENWDLFLVARDSDRLARAAHDLRSVYGVNVITESVDLTDPAGVDRLAERLDEMRLAPEALVNNAGIAGSGRFMATDRTKVAATLDLNVRALTLLTHAVLQGMMARNTGRILNVASTAAFQPVPGMATYAATKAFVLSFTEGLSEELRDSNVSVTALCPGLTNTDMVGDLRAAEVPKFLLHAPREVAREGYEALMAGEAVRIPGVANQMGAAWAKWYPRSVVRYVSGMVSRFAFDY